MRCLFSYSSRIPLLGVPLLGLASLLATGVPSPLHAQTQVVAASVNGVLNPTQFAGVDIGDQVNKAWASGLGKTVRIPPGSWSFATTIVHPGLGYLLQCDAGTVLTYTGTGDAITLSNGNSTGASGAGIDGTGGCQLIGKGIANTNGIHIFYSNNTFVRNMAISYFNTAILDTGGNSVELQTLSIHNNTNGIFVTGSSSPAGAGNAVHLSDSEISGNSGWGFWSEDSGCSCTNNLANTITDNVFEENTTGDVFLDWDYGSSVQGNYFESTGPGVAIGTNENNWGITVAQNYFTSNGGTRDRITIGYGAYFHIEENAELGSTSTGCFIDVTTGPYGYATNFFGVGTNLARSTHEWCLHGTGTTNP
jgi:hypothetical protein